jgi:hypothetical protein
MLLLTLQQDRMVYPVLLRSLRSLYSPHTPQVLHSSITFWGYNKICYKHVAPAEIAIIFTQNFLNTCSFPQLYNKRLGTCLQHSRKSTHLRRRCDLQLECANTTTQTSCNIEVLFANLLYGYKKRKAICSI